MSGDAYFWMGYILLFCSLLAGMARKRALMAGLIIAGLLVWSNILIMNGAAK